MKHSLPTFIPPGFQHVKNFSFESGDLRVSVWHGADGERLQPLPQLHLQQFVREPPLVLRVRPPWAVHVEERRNADHIFWQAVVVGKVPRPGPSGATPLYWY